MRCLVTLVGVSALGACGGDATAPAAVPEPEVDLSDVEIRLDRTECYGTCPSYEVVIRGSGNVWYTGRNFVKETGRRDGKLSQETVRDLVARFEAIGFFDLEHECEFEIFDVSSTTLSLRIGKRSKVVLNRWADFPGASAGEPVYHEALASIADRIDQVVDVERWIGSGTIEADRASGQGGQPGRK